jgi:hypothetical protein
MVILWDAMGRTSGTHAVSLVLALAAIAGAKSFTRDLDSAGRDQVELWVDPYYSALNLTHSLVSEPIERLNSDGERSADLWLLRNLLRPRDILVEGSVNPLPSGGWALRKWSPDAYHGASIEGLNLVQALVEGFPEPCAASLFLGNVVDLVSAADTTKVNGTAYSGLLVSGGPWHLVRSHLVSDDWVEAEVKIKGDDLRADRKMGWSFRAGGRWNRDPEVRDLFYGSLVRRRTDFKEHGWNPLRNSSLELRLDLDQASFPHLVPVRWTAVAGKKFPFANGSAAFSLNLGLVDDLRPAYDGSLRPLAPWGLHLVLQPDLEW